MEEKVVRVQIDGEPVDLHGLRFTMVGTAEVMVPFLNIPGYADVTQSRFTVWGVNAITPEGTTDEQALADGERFVETLAAMSADSFLDGVARALNKRNELAELIDGLDLDGEEAE